MKTFIKIIILVVLLICYTFLLGAIIVRPDIFSASTLRINSMLFYVVMIIRITEWLMTGLYHGSGWGGDRHKYA